MALLTPIVFATENPIARQTRRRVDLGLMPFLFLLFIVAYLDRVNVAFAGLQMTKDPGFSDAVFGFGGGIFFVAERFSSLVRGGGLLLRPPGILASSEHLVGQENSSGEHRSD